MEFSGRSRISRWGGGGADLRHVCFSAKTCAKTKELDPVGGHRQWETMISFNYLLSSEVESGHAFRKYSALSLGTNLPT